MGTAMHATPQKTPEPGRSRRVPRSSPPSGGGKSDGGRANRDVSTHVLGSLMDAPRRPAQTGAGPFLVWFRFSAGAKGRGREGRQASLAADGAAEA